jgi:hypothetical protein
MVYVLQWFVHLFLLWLCTRRPHITVQYVEETNQYLSYVKLVFRHSMLGNYVSQENNSIRKNKTVLNNI